MLFAGIEVLLLLVLWDKLITPALPEDPRRLYPTHPRIHWVAPDLGPFLSAESPETAELLFLGDSRVYNAILPAAFERAGFGEVAVYSRGGAQLVELLAAARFYPARRLVVALSPLSIHGGEPDERVQNRRLAEPPPLTTARIDTVLQESLLELRWNHLRLIDATPWAESWFPVPDPRANNAAAQLNLRPSTRRARAEALRTVFAMLDDLKRDGWDIVCVRLPISEPLRRIEEAAFPGVRFQLACRASDLPYFDYSAAEVASWDGSHVTMHGAEFVTQQLIADLGEHVDWSAEAAQAPPRAR